MLDSRNVMLARLAVWVLRLIQEGRDLHAAHRMNLPLLVRYTSHLGIVALTLLAILFGGVEIRAAGPTAVPGTAQGQDLPPIQSKNQSNLDNFTLSAIPFTIVPARVRREVVEYLVQPGDTVTGIGARFHISADSILWANSKLEDNPDMLSLGQTLNIPPTSGVLYTVAQGDTVQTIAAKFAAKIEDIIADPFDQSNHDLKSKPATVDRRRVLDGAWRLQAVRGEEGDVQHLSSGRCGARNQQLYMASVGRLRFPDLLVAAFGHRPGRPDRDCGRCG